MVDKGDTKKEDKGSGGKGDMNGRDLYYPKYGNSIYDNKVQEQFKTDSIRWKEENKAKNYEDRED